MKNRKQVSHHHALQPLMKLVCISLLTNCQLSTVTMITYSNQCKYNHYPIIPFFYHPHLQSQSIFADTIPPVSSVGSIIDQPKGYGPVNVYNKLDKTKALRNADSYMYFALVSAIPLSITPGSPSIHFVTLALTWVCDLQENLFTILCKKTDGFAAPRPGIDDEDPDCKKQACQPCFDVFLI